MDVISDVRPRGTSSFDLHGNSQERQTNRVSGNLRKLVFVAPFWSIAELGYIRAFYWIIEILRIL